MKQSQLLPYKNLFLLKDLEVKFLFNMNLLNWFTLNLLLNASCTHAVMPEYYTLRI